MPKVLITGSSGFLGRNLIKFAPDHHQIIAHYRHNLPDSYGRSVEFFQCDFSKEPWQSLEKFHPDIMIHTAAMASIDECEIQPDRAHLTNYIATTRLVQFASQRNIRFIYISSDVVFDGLRGNYSETDLPSPTSVYAESKSSAEKYILEHHGDAVVVRPAIFYGLSLFGRPSFTEVMLNNLYAGKQVYVFTDQFRTPALINNLVSALWELTEHDYRGVLHLGGPQKINRWEIGKLLCQIFKLDENLLVPVKSIDIQLPVSRPLDCSLDSSQATSLLKTVFVDCKTGLHLAYR